jgi:hypothetical protein
MAAILALWSGWGYLRVALSTPAEVGEKPDQHLKD